MRLGFVGLGIMGTPMAQNLANGGYELTVWNRTEAKASAWAAANTGKAAATPAVREKIVFFIAHEDSARIFAPEEWQSGRSRRS